MTGDTGHMDILAVAFICRLCCRQSLEDEGVYEDDVKQRVE